MVTPNMELASLGYCFALVLALVFIVMWLHYLNSVQYILDQFRKSCEKAIKTGEACSRNALLLMKQLHKERKEITVEGIRESEFVLIPHDQALLNLDQGFRWIDNYGERLREKEVVPTEDYLEKLHRTQNAHEACKRCWQEGRWQEGCALASVLENGNPLEFEQDDEEEVTQ